MAYYELITELKRKRVSYAFRGITYVCRKFSQACRLINVN